jgi:hypothetical protein
VSSASSMPYCCSGLTCPTRSPSLLASIAPDLFDEHTSRVAEQIDLRSERGRPCTRRRGRYQHHKFPRSKIFNGSRAWRLIEALRTSG